MIGSVLRYRVLWPGCCCLSHAMVPSSVTVSTVAGMRLPLRSTIMTLSPNVSSFQSSTGLQRGRGYAAISGSLMDWVEIMFWLTFGIRCTTRGAEGWRRRPNASTSGCRNHVRLGANSSRRGSPGLGGRNSSTVEVEQAGGVSTQNGRLGVGIKTERSNCGDRATRREGHRGTVGSEADAVCANGFDGQP